MGDPSKQEVERTVAPSETTIIQLSESTNPEMQPEAVSEIPGDIKTLAGNLGTALEDSVLAKKHTLGQNAITEGPQNAPWHQRVTPTDLTGGVTYEWLKDVTSRLATLEGSQTKNNSKKADGKDQAEIIERVKTEPKVRDCNWEQFKNRYIPEECTFAIEVLLAGDDLETEIEEEQLRRLPPEQRRRVIQSAQKKPTRRPRADKRPDSQQLERVRINSPAILSFLGAVTGETTWVGKPHTFLRPFKTLIHFHDQLEQEFEKLKARFEDNCQFDLESSPSPSPSPESVETDKASLGEDPPASGIEGRQEKLTEDQLPKKDSAIAIESPEPPVEPTKGPPPIEDEKSTPKGEPVSLLSEHTVKDGYNEIQCYMEFARTRLLPTYRKFEGKDHNQNVKVRFDDLWSLFRTGEFVFKPEDSKSNASIPETESHRSPSGRANRRKLWRVHIADSDTIDWTVENLNPETGNLRIKPKEKNDKFKIVAYYIDYNGISYTAVARIWTIPRFEGEREVTKLEFYPVRFEKDFEATISKLEESGERFQKLLLSGDPAVRHDGWTLTQKPTGEQLLDEAGKTAEYIDSDVIIDFHEAYQTKPVWKPVFSALGKTKSEVETSYDEFTIIEWNGPDRSTATAKLTEVVISSEGVASLKWNEFADKDDFIRGRHAGPVENRQVRRELSGQDLALLPTRMFAYSLRNRKFINADIQNLKPLEAMSDPFSDLKMAESNKRLIRSVVRDHFEKKSIQRQLRARNIEPLEQDFIRGKGKGLVILLHGAPGVGKTATAEAVAATHRKPLFAITCGDLGIDPRQVESTLSEIFRLANLWDCILLLDEAEIFLSRREKKDDNLQRNALVSIFLRTLEYYPGILFLTTNRVGVLDEALNSRVHVSIYFRHLDAEQTMALFDMNLKRSEMIAEQRAMSTKEPPLLIKAEEIRGFALTHFAKHAGGPGGLGTWWNGRQIRNAFQIATSLAYADARDQKDDEKRYLGREHFDQVLQAMEEYTQYRQDLLHKTDDDLAADREERYFRAGGDNAGRRESPRYGPMYSDYPRPRSFHHQRPSYPPSPSSARPFAGREGEYARQDADTPTPQRQEPFLAPGAYPGGGDRPMSRGEFHDQGREYGHPGRRM